MSSRGSASGFTLIEVLASLALASILLVGVLTLALSVKKSESRLPAAREIDTSLPELLRQDLVLGRRVWFEGGRIVIEGYGWLDENTAAVSHRPATVTYGLIEVGERLALVRAQEASDGATSVDLIAADVVAFDVEPDRATREEESHDVPDSVHLTVVRRAGGDTQPVTFSHQIVLQ